MLQSNAASAWKRVEFSFFLIVILVRTINGALTKIDSYTIEPKDNGELYCLSSLPPPRTIQWFKDGREIKSVAGQYEIKADSLEIIGVGEADVGEYICKDVGSGETAHVYMNAGAWSENGKNIAKFEGNSFTVDCHAWGYPTPVIKWYKDGKELVINGSHYVLEDRPTTTPNVTLKNGRLRINKAKRSDTGKYKCFASNPTGQHNASTSVLVQSLVTLILPIIGIILLLIVLAVGIGLFVYFTNKYKKDQKKLKSKWKKMEAKRNKQLAVA